MTSDVLTGMSNYERIYNRHVNLRGFLFLLAHFPILCLLAFLGPGGNVVPAAGIMLLLLAGPAMVLFSDASSPLGAIAIAVAAMGLSALAIHVTGGMIEAHFEIFVLIALLTVYGRIAPLLAAGATIAAHHLIFWLWLPASVFNYKASIWIVLVHAAFVIIEVVPACWIARQFGRSIRAQGLVKDHLEGCSEQIGNAAREISNYSQTVAKGASAQAATFQETSASVEQVNAMAQRNSSNSDETASLVASSQRRFDETNHFLEGMVSAMDGLNTSSEQIRSIIRVIDQIAFQTNILALNAAVEAAHAGESGAGFAVVAGEVRDLAHRSAQAARDTSALIEESLQRTSTVKTQVDELSREMRCITSDSKRVKVLVDQINTGSEQQFSGIAQIARAIQAMEQATQSNAASAEQSAAAAEQLAGQSHIIRGLVIQLGKLGLQVA